MSVRAKFRCDNIEPADDDLVTISMSPVYDSNPESENGRFWKYTPWGSVQLGTINKAASDQFEVGKEYFVDFSPADQ